MRVTILRLGDAEKVVSATPGSSAADVLAAASVSTDGMTVSRNGHPVPLGAEVRDGDILTVSPKVTGGC